MYITSETDGFMLYTFFKSKVRPLGIYFLLYTMGNKHRLKFNFRESVQVHSRLLTILKIIGKGSTVLLIYMINNNAINNRLISIL